MPMFQPLILELGFLFSNSSQASTFEEIRHILNQFEEGIWLTVNDMRDRWDYEVKKVCMEARIEAVHELKEEMRASLAAIDGDMGGKRRTEKMGKYFEGEGGGAKRRGWNYEPERGESEEQGRDFEAKGAEGKRDRGKGGGEGGGTLIEGLEQWK